MNIEALFEEVRLLFFPRWDSRREWTATYGDAEQRRNSTGYCDSSAKTVYLDRRGLCRMPRDGIRALLIHEICHEVGAAHHNLKWAKRMEVAAVRADELNETEVAEILRSDIISYCSASVPKD